MDGGAWWAAVHGVARSWTWLTDFTFTFHFHALEKEMATHSSVLAWRIPGTGEPGGLPSLGSHRVGHDWSDLAAAAAAPVVAITIMGWAPLLPLIQAFHRHSSQPWEGLPWHCAYFPDESLQHCGVCTAGPVTCSAEKVQAQKQCPQKVDNDRAWEPCLGPCSFYWVAVWLSSPTVPRGDRRNWEGKPFEWYCNEELHTFLMWC